MKNLDRSRLTGSLVLGLLLGASAPAAEAPNPEDRPVFEKHILPILRENCLSCHGGLRSRVKLDLRSHVSALKGSESGAVIQPGAPETSLLWKKLAANEMPKEGQKLSDKDKGLIRAWIAAGAAGAPPLPAPRAADQPRDPAAVAAEIDNAINRKLQAARVTPAPRSDDAEFLRRTYLDITGRIPTVAQARALLDSQAADKRARLIDELLARPEYGQHFATIWHHQLMPLTPENKRDYHEAVLKWLAESFQRGPGWDKTVGELLTITGDAKTEPRTLFLLGKAEPGPIALQTGRLLLGIDMECAECHNHPLTQWRQQEDFWGLAAFYGQLSYGGMKNKLTEKLPKGTVAIKIPDTALTSVGVLAPVRYPGLVQPVAAGSPRTVLADWLASRDNPYFAPNAANRTWAHCFGRGLVNPLHDMHTGNPPSHPEVLALLADEFRASGFDFKHLLRCICRSETYQRSSRGAVGQELRPELFERMALKAMTPDVLYDSLCIALDRPELEIPKPAYVRTKGGPPPPSTRMVFVNRFDHPELPLPATEYTYGEQQVLLLMNLQQLNAAPERIQRLNASEQAEAAALDEIYLSALARRPAPAEKALLAAYRKQEADLQRVYLHLFWALLNSKEFVFNH